MHMKAFKLSYLILILFGSLLYFEGFLTYYLSVYIKNNYFLALIMLLIALLILFLYKFLSKGTIRKNFSSFIKFFSFDFACCYKRRDNTKIIAAGKNFRYSGLFSSSINCSH